MKTFASKQWLAVTGSLCNVYRVLARASFANIYQEFGTMTHLSSHDISWANSGHSLALMSPRSARWLASPVKIPPAAPDYQRHLYRLQNIAASQRPVFGNQPTKLWLWYRRESKLSFKYFPSTKWNIFTRKIWCVGLWFIYICDQPVIFELFLWPPVVPGCSFEPRSTGVVLSSEPREWRVSNTGPAQPPLVVCGILDLRADSPSCPVK